MGPLATGRVMEWCSPLLMARSIIALYWLTRCSWESDDASSQAASSPVAAPAKTGFQYLPCDVVMGYSVFVGLFEIEL